MSSQRQIIVSGGFDDIKSRDLRFLEEAARLGELSVLLWPDATLQKLTGKPPKFPLAERKYFLNAVRYVSRVIEADGSASFDTLPENLKADIWADVAATASPAREAFARENKIARRVFKPDELKGFPEPRAAASRPVARKSSSPAATTGFTPATCDFSRRSALMATFTSSSGTTRISGCSRAMGHPLIPQDERRYVVGSIKFVKQALISSGDGWLDADPEIKRLKPDIYAVNEDGDKGGKREYCRKLGIEYLVLKRTPAPGLPRRSSTDLRGF